MKSAPTTANAGARRAHWEAPVSTRSSRRWPRLRGRGLALLWALAGVILWAGAATAQTKRMMPLAVWPHDKVLSLAPLLRSADAAVIESKPDGHLRQLSLFTFIAAAPSTVREVLWRADLYRDYVQNFKKSVVTNNPDGNFDYSYQLSFGLFTIEGTNRYMQLPADPHMAVPPVEIRDLDPNFDYSVRRFRFEFYSVYGGTLMVMYGFTEVTKSGGVIAKVLDKVPTLEQGMALVAESTLLLQVKRRAEQIAPITPQPPPHQSASVDFLIDRGTVVLLRSQSGRLSEVSLIDRTPAPPQQIAALVQQTSDWKDYIPSITQSVGTGAQDTTSMVDIEQSLPLLSFRTTYGARVQGRTVDMMGLSGDLKGARMRWDLVPTSAGGTQIVLRSSLQYDRASLIMRQLYKLEPLMEYGVNVGMQLVILEAIRTRAERTSGRLRPLVAFGPETKVY